jgi:phosphate transport system substrate-binding protein
MNRKVGRLGALLLVTALVAVACGDDDGSATTAGSVGSVAISGSSTVLPISARVAEAFLAANPGLSISVEGPGTGDGFALFCSGEIDISDASRPIRDSEADTCADAGIEWIELQVAIDGLSVITSVNNTLFECLDTADLYALLSNESIGFESWADANELAAEIGAPNAPYPDVDLEVTAPGEESGTFDSFVEFLIDGVGGGVDYAEVRGIDNVRPDYVASGDDNLIIAGIAGTDTSLGWVGYAYYVENQDRVKALGISTDGTGDNCVDPSAATIADGSYPFSRPLFIYVNAAASDRPEVAAFVDYYLSETGLAAVGEAGYVAMADYSPVIANWMSRTTGRVFSA